MAKSVVARRSTRERVELLEAATGRRAGSVGAADGSTATTTGKFPRRLSVFEFERKHQPRVDGTQSATRNNFVHDVAGGVQDVALSLHGTDRSVGGNAGSESQ